MLVISGGDVAVLQRPQPGSEGPCRVRGQEGRGEPSQGDACRVRGQRVNGVYHTRAFSPEHAESRAVRGPAGANAVSRAGPEPGPPATAGCQGRVHGDVTATDGKNRLRTAWAGTTSVPVWPRGLPIWPELHPVSPRAQHMPDAIPRRGGYMGESGGVSAEPRAPPRPQLHAERHMALVTAGRKPGDAAVAG